jgi:prolyl 4-hydroxylase
MTTSLSPEWRQWIESNLLRKCTIRSMIEEMVAKNFDVASAAAFIATVSGEIKQAGDRQAEPSSPSYQYPDRSALQTPHVTTFDRTIRVRMRIERPEVLLLESVLSHDECDELVRRANEKLSPSTTVDPISGEMKPVQDRTSVGTYFPLEDNELIARLDRRLAEIAKLPLDHSEGIQILRYSVGGEYKPHFDFFPPNEAGSSVHTAQGGQRIATIVMYLNDVEEGGETVFPKIHLAIPPRKGDAVYFGYFNALGQVDRRTLHGGAPVTKGEKWIATKWFRQFKRR